MRARVHSGVDRHGPIPDSARARALRGTAGAPWRRRRAHEGLSAGVGRRSHRGLSLSLSRRGQLIRSAAPGQFVLVGAAFKAIVVGISV